MTAAVGGRGGGLEQAGFGDGALDIREPRFFAVALVGELTVVNTEEAFLFIADQARTFFTLPDGALVGEETPRSPESARIAALGGSTANQTRAPVGPLFVELVTSTDAVALREEPEVAARLTTVDERVRVEAHVQVRGFATGQEFNDGEPRPLVLTAISQQFAVPIDLCIGCLVPTCEDNERLTGGGCFSGLDLASACELE